jgi:glycosyltransferase involved in cell wall biosynthesis
MTPFFSVIVPVYNRAAALQTAIASVLAQSEQDFEIVVVDDGSTDRPEETVSSFADPRIVLVRQENRGGGAARNAGIDRASGRFVAFLDSDDAFLPHHLGALRKLLEGTAGVAGYARLKVDRGGGRIILKPPRAIRAGEDMAVYLMCERGFVPTITLAVEREQAKRVRYRENLPPAEDTDFAIRLAICGVTFRMLPEPGAVWRDVADVGRLSADLRGEAVRVWLEELRPRISARAYYGALGWSYAKCLAAEGKRGQALGLCLSAIARGCYPAGLAGIVALQVLLSGGAYRRLADAAIRWLGAGLRKP